MNGIKLNSRILELVTSLWKYKYSWLLIALIYLLLTPIFFPKEFALLMFYGLPIYLLIQRKIDFWEKLKKADLLYLIIVCLPSILYIIYILNPQKLLLVIASCISMLFLLEFNLMYIPKLIKQDKNIIHQDIVNQEEENNNSNDYTNNWIKFIQYIPELILGSKEEQVYDQPIYGAISIYLLLGILWFFVYLIIGVYQEEAFSFPLKNGMTKINIIEQPFDFLYLSFTTLTTVGYGDIYPISIVAKIFTNLEGIIGVMFPAVVIARFVGKL